MGSEYDDGGGGKRHRGEDKEDTEHVWMMGDFETNRTHHTCQFRSVILELQHMITSPQSTHNAIDIALPPSNMDRGNAAVDAGGDRATTGSTGPGGLTGPAAANNCEQHQDTEDTADDKGNDRKRAFSPGNAAENTTTERGTAARLTVSEPERQPPNSKTDELDRLTATTARAATVPLPVEEGGGAPLHPTNLLLAAQSCKQDPQTPLTPVPRHVHRLRSGPCAR